MPMASNIQMVLYRNDSGECLGKVLYNEHEVRLKGLKPVSGPYYRWADVVSRICNLLNGHNSGNFRYPLAQRPDVWYTIRTKPYHKET